MSNAMIELFNKKDSYLYYVLVKLYCSPFELNSSLNLNKRALLLLIELYT